jgi:hypothetical protein
MKRRAHAWRWGLVLFLAAALSRPTLAHAEESRALAARVTEQWHTMGGDAVTLPSRFIFDDETLVVPIPHRPADPVRPCTIVAIVGPRGLSFRARLSDAPRDPLSVPEPQARGVSTAGIVELRRCDSGRPEVRHVTITAESGRGAIELVVAHAPFSMDSLSSLLPERSAAPSLSPIETGRLPDIGPPEKRAQTAISRARREGATPRGMTHVRSMGDGSGGFVFDAEPGCHRFEVFGHEVPKGDPSRRATLDIDAEVRDEDTMLARDRTESPDARLEFCLGETTSLTLVFTGSVPNSDVMLTHVSWDLTNNLPDLWGPLTRARFAKVWRTRHAPPPRDAPVFLAQGAAGVTSIPLTVEPGGCYVATVAITRGRPRQLQLRAFSGARAANDDRGASDGAALTAFCVRAGESPRIDVLARGLGLGWGLAVYRTTSETWELSP